MDSANEHPHSHLNLERYERKKSRAKLCRKNLNDSFEFLHGVLGTVSRKGEDRALLISQAAQTILNLRQKLEGNGSSLHHKAENKQVFEVQVATQSQILPGSVCSRCLEQVGSVMPLPTGPNLTASEPNLSTYSISSMTNTACLTQIHETVGYQPLRFPDVYVPGQDPQRSKSPDIENMDIPDYQLLLSPSWLEGSPFSSPGVTSPGRNNFNWIPSAELTNQDFGAVNWDLLEPFDHMDKCQVSFRKSCATEAVLAINRLSAAIFLYLDPESAILSALVCKKFQYHSFDNDLWLHFINRRWGADLANDLCRKMLMGESITRHHYFRLQRKGILPALPSGQPDSYSLVEAIVPSPFAAALVIAAKGGIGGQLRRVDVWAGLARRSNGQTLRTVQQSPDGFTTRASALEVVEMRILIQNCRAEPICITPNSFKILTKEATAFLEVSKAPGVTDNRFFPKVLYFSSVNPCTAAAPNCLSSCSIALFQFALISVYFWAPGCRHEDLFLQKCEFLEFQISGKEISSEIVQENIHCTKVSVPFFRIDCKN